MNVFDAIYLNIDDPIERTFIAAETTLDIAVDTANKEYVFECGLIDFSDDRLFIESEENNTETDAKKENAFVKAVKAICTAIKNFISDLVSTIIGIFDTRERITDKDYLASNTGKVRLERDVRKLEEIVDDEILKGNKLLQKVSSITGISDKAIDDWVQKSSERISKVAPVVISAAAAFGFRQFFKWKDKKKAIEKAEKEATDGDNSDSKKNKQKLTILGHMNKLIKEVGSGWNDWTKAMDRASKRQSK